MLSDQQAIFDTTIRFKVNDSDLGGVSFYAVARTSEETTIIQDHIAELANEIENAVRDKTETLREKLSESRAKTIADDWEIEEMESEFDDE